METLIQSNREIKVSVIMPIYNAGEYLSRAIGDVLRQSFAEIELICVDDGSTDNSAKIIERYKNKDDRVSYIHQSNQGPSIARNQGLKMARGRYVIFLDADDMYEPTLIQLLYEAAEAQTLDVAVAKFDIYDESQNKYISPVLEPDSQIFDGGAVTSKNEHPHKIFTSTTGYAWNKLFRTSFLIEKGLSFDPDLYVFEDVHFVCSTMALAERVQRIDGVLIHHRVYFEQSRSTLFRKYYGQVPVVYSKLRQFLMSQGMYIPLKKGYLNLSAGRCYKIFNLLWADGKERMWNLLHDQYVAELDWLNNDRADIENAEVRDFVANVALYQYAEFLDREERGRTIDVENLETDDLSKKVNQKQKISRRRAVWNKIMSFINIFRKKK